MNNQLLVLNKPLRDFRFRGHSQLTMVSQLTIVPWSGPDLMRTQKLEGLVQLKLRHDAWKGLIWVSPFSDANFQTPTP